MGVFASLQCLSAAKMFQKSLKQRLFRIDMVDFKRKKQTNTNRGSQVSFVAQAFMC